MPASVARRLDLGERTPTDSHREGGTDTDSGNEHRRDIHRPQVVRLARRMNGSPAPAAASANEHGLPPEHTHDGLIPPSRNCSVVHVSSVHPAVWVCRTGLVMLCRFFDLRVDKVDRVEERTDSQMNPSIYAVHPAVYLASSSKPADDGWTKGVSSSASGQPVRVPVARSNTSRHSGSGGNCQAFSRLPFIAVDVFPASWGQLDIPPALKCLAK
jgi:hypothetical protein